MYLSKSDALSAATSRADGLFPLESAAATGKFSEIDGYDDRDDDANEGLVLVDEAALAEYAEFLAAADDPEPLTVTEEDGGRKRYKAYRTVASKEEAFSNSTSWIQSTRHKMDKLSML